MTRVHFSSASDDWQTPQSFFDAIARRFNFVLDVCASEKNTKCFAYFNKEANGLEQNWVVRGDVWMNPPYGRGIGEWVRKAYETAAGGARWFAFCQRAQTQNGGMTTA